MVACRRVARHCPNAFSRQPPDVRDAICDLQKIYRLQKQIRERRAANRWGTVDRYSRATFCREHILISAVHRSTVAGLTTWA
jgi:hypothetical protein